MAGDYDVVEASIGALAADMAAGKVTSEALTAAYAARIAAIDRAGPTLRSVICLSPTALDEARALDAERRDGGVRGPLHGVPLLIKDNIDSADGTATTAGSLALRGNVTRRDAPVVRRLKDAGAVILGKTNLSEWANMPLGPFDQRLVGGRRAGEEPLCAGSQRRRLVVGDGQRDRRLVGRGRRRHRDRRLGHRARRIRRPGGPEADGGPDLAHPRRADLGQPGHARADGPHRRGRGDPADRDGRIRPGRSGHRAGRRPPRATTSRRWPARASPASGWACCTYASHLRGAAERVFADVLARLRAEGASVIELEFKPAGRSRQERAHGAADRAEGRSQRLFRHPAARPCRCARWPT